VIDVVRSKLEPQEWTQEFLSTCGSLSEDFPDEIPELPQQEREGWLLRAAEPGARPRKRK
jgi:hypothetical protein